MAETQRKLGRTIDCTPTWEAATRIYLTVLENGNAEGKKAAREELLRLAKAYDTLQTEYNKLVDKVNVKPAGKAKKMSML